MIPSLSQSSCVDFSLALFSAPLPFFQTLRGPGIPDCFCSSSDTCSCLHAFTHQISTWSALSLFPHCTTLPIFWEPTLSAKSSVKLGKSVCFLCCLTLHSDKEYYLRNICRDPLYVPALNYRDEKTKSLPLKSQDNCEMGMPYSVILNICTKHNEHKRRNSWESMCVGGWGVTREDFIYN